MCFCFLKLVCPKTMSHSKLPITWMDVWWLNVITLNPGGFLSHGGTPIAGRFLMENPTSRVDDLGIILWLWKPLHIYIYIYLDLLNPYISPQLRLVESSCDRWSWLKDRRARWPRPDPNTIDGWLGWLNRRKCLVQHEKHMVKPWLVGGFKHVLFPISYMG